MAHPSLTSSAPLRYGTFGALYFVQGIPQGLQLYAIPAWMAMHGISAAVVGSYVAVCTLPWTFKIVVGPLMDRYGFLPMGRRRPWLLGAQVGLLLSLLAMAMVPDPLNNMALFMGASFVVNCFGATQDVATDGLAVDVTPPDQQARANGIMWGSKVVGIGVTLSAGTWAINRFGFSVAVAAITGAMLVLMILPSMLRERRGERLLPWSRGEAAPEVIAMKPGTWSEILFTLKSSFLMRNSLIASSAIFLFGLAWGLSDAAWPVFTVQRLGWSNEAYADLVAGAGIVAALAAMVAAGWLADRVGKTRIIPIYLALYAACWVTFAAMSGQWHANGFVAAAIYAGQFLCTFCNVAALAAAMGLCWMRVAATQFTLYMVCNNLGLAIGAWLLGPLQHRLGWSGLFLCLAGLLFSAMMLWRLVRLEEHQRAVGALEAAFSHRNRPVAVLAGTMDLGVPRPMA